jgi:hypothetical protein
MGCCGGIVGGMKAKIRELGSGKYYGSIVDIDLGDGSHGSIEVWIHDNRREPSGRQLRVWGMERVTEAKAHDMCSDSHFESDVGYAACRRIELALNAEGFEV